MSHFKLACQIALSPQIISKAIKVALVVGSILNIINQGDILFSVDFMQVNLFKFLLTYLVPYSVTTYTATTMKMQFQIGTNAVASVDLECRVCQYQAHVEKNDIIPECPKCGVKTHWKLKKIR